ncbi:hypothetical protein CG401_03045, partial [Bifidobacteriaceae bacterium NR019]
MDSITAHNLTFEDEVLQVLSSAKDAHPHDVDSSIMAMMCVERDTRFYADTLHAVLSQSILPGTLVIVDCASRVKQTMQTNLQIKINSSMLAGAINTRKSLLQNANNIDSNNAIDSDSKYKPNTNRVNNTRVNNSEDKSVRIIIIPISYAHSFGDAIE